MEIGDGQIDEITADDRFFGVTYIQGLSSIEISQTKIASGGFAIEVDHFQYGYNILIDPAQYGASYLDIITGIGYNLSALEQHFFNSGRFEGRQPNLIR